MGSFRAGAALTASFPSRVLQTRFTPPARTHHQGRHTTEVDVPLLQQAHLAVGRAADIAVKVAELACDVRVHLAGTVLDVRTPHTDTTHTSTGTGSSVAATDSSTAAVARGVSVHRFNFEHRLITAIVDAGSDIHYRTGTPGLRHGRERHRETTTKQVEHISEETTHSHAGTGSVVIASPPGLGLADVMLRAPTVTRHRR